MIQRLIWYTRNGCMNHECTQQTHWWRGLSLGEREEGNEQRNHTGNELYTNGIYCVKSPLRAHNVPSSGHCFCFSRASCIALSCASGSTVLDCQIEYIQKSPIVRSRWHIEVHFFSLRSYNIVGFATRSRNHRALLDIVNSKPLKTSGNDIARDSQQRYFQKHNYVFCHMTRCVGPHILMVLAALLANGCCDWKKRNYHVVFKTSAHDWSKNQLSHLIHRLRFSLRPKLV